MKNDFDTTTQEYIEIIYEIQQAKKVARVKDIARKRGVTLSSVSTALTVLRDKKLIKHESYGLVELTDRGYSLGASLEKKHRTLKNFFTEILGVKDSVAEDNACTFEHYVNPEVLDSLVDFIAFFEKNPVWLEKYNKFKQVAE
jgi:DtxR family Mn-dependent transcriptional regulator